MDQIHNVNNPFKEFTEPPFFCLNGCDTWVPPAWMMNSIGEKDVSWHLQIVLISDFEYLQQKHHMYGFAVGTVVVLTRFWRLSGLFTHAQMLLCRHYRRIVWWRVWVTSKKLKNSIGERVEATINYMNGLHFNVLHTYSCF